MKYKDQTQSTINTLFVICLIQLSYMPQTAQAYLGGFEEGDGYSFSKVPQANTLADRDVTRYNAGQYGTNNGGPGGSATLITPDTGLWQVIAGGRLENRTNDYYIINHPAPQGHSSSNVLGMTTGNSTYVGVDTEYQYQFDTRDFDGHSPGSLGNRVVDVEFDWCPLNLGLGGFSSMLTDPGSTLQFQDSGGNNFFEIGSYGPSENVAYRILGGLWVDAGFSASSASNSDFDQINLSFDLENNTVSFSYFETAAAINHVVLAKASLGGNMDYLGHFGLTMKAENTKNFLDDFDFRIQPVSEPSVLVLVIIGLIGFTLANRRRRISLYKWSRE